MPGEQAFGMALLATAWLVLDANDGEHTVHVDVVVWGPTFVEATPALSLSFYRYLDFGAGLDGLEDVQLRVKRVIVQNGYRESGIGDPGFTPKRFGSG